MDEKKIWSIESQKSLIEDNNDEIENQKKEQLKNVDGKAMEGHE